jgi:nitric oxide reductase NorD protein
MPPSPGDPGPADSGSSDRRRYLASVLAGEPRLVDTLDLMWYQVQAGIPAARLDDWLDACRLLAASELGAACSVAYVRNAPGVAATAGVDAAIALAQALPGFAALAGSHATASLIVAAPKAARRLKTSEAFAEWLRVLRDVAKMAPESVTLLLDRTDTVLQDLDMPAFEAWSLSGIRAAAGDVDQRRTFFALEGPNAHRQLAHSGDEVLFPDVERRLKAYMMALWHRNPPLRALAGGPIDLRRRASFDGGIVRLPDAFRGFSPAEAKRLFLAAVAHIGAHLQFGTVRFPVGNLKPVQVALISLIEDARVEQLAIGRFPGLRRLWLPFHVATAAGAITAASLMARLARALIDPDYVDDNGWVTKGRETFFAAADRWDDPAVSRALGGLLGNDLGQMRAQFNAKTYVVEPAYRDDNQGLWDFGVSSTAPEDETFLDSVRLEQTDDQIDNPDLEHETPDAGAREDRVDRAALLTPNVDVGIPVARYPEWDYVIGRDRAEWTTIVEYTASEGRAARIDDILERRPELVHRIMTLIRSAKVSRPVRLRRQPEGDRLDLDACVDAAVDRRLSGFSEPKVYAKLERRFRDLSVLVLLDASQSTNDIAPGIGKSILDIEREATALLSHGMAKLGDPFAIHAFCSDTRADVRYYRIKDFGTPYDEAAKRRLAGLTGRFSTRMGAALRHAGRELSGQMSYRRLLLMISDGEPSDVDVADRRYLVEDARRAVLALSHIGIDVFCVGLDAAGDSYLTRIFGRRNVVQVDRIERLPEKLPMLYLRLTGS